MIFINIYIFSLNFVTVVWCKTEGKRGFETKSKGRKRKNNGRETPEKGTGKIGKRTREGKAKKGARGGKSRERKTETRGKSKIPRKDESLNLLKNIYQIYVLILWYT